jgi:hypothetical protein
MKSHRRLRGQRAMMMKQAKEGGPVCGFSRQNWLNWILAS